MEDLRSMKKLWVHEVLRVFYDRLVDTEDRTWLLDRVASACTTHLNEDFHQLLAELDENMDGVVSGQVETSFMVSFTTLVKPLVFLLMMIVLW